MPTSSSKCLGKMQRGRQRPVAPCSSSATRCASIERLCDRVLLLDGGRIAFDGPTAEGVSRYLHQSFEAVGNTVPEDRPGTGEIRITDVSVPTQNVAAEDPKRIQFRLEQRVTGSTVASWRWSCATPRGSPWRTATRTWSGEWFSVADGPVEGEFTLATPWLHPGDYVADLYVCNAGILDSFDNACKFTVRPGYPYAAGHRRRAGTARPGAARLRLRHAGARRAGSGRPRERRRCLRRPCRRSTPTCSWPTSPGSPRASVRTTARSIGWWCRTTWTGVAGTARDLSAEIARGRELIEALDVDGQGRVWLEADFVPADHDPSVGRRRSSGRPRSTRRPPRPTGSCSSTPTRWSPTSTTSWGRWPLTDRAGVDGLEYSARWLHTHVRGRWFTEPAPAGLGFWDGIPGPVAVRAGTQLKYHRQIDGPSRRLAVSAPAPTRHIPLERAILHFSMVRTAGCRAPRSPRRTATPATSTGRRRSRRWIELTERPLGEWPARSCNRWASTASRPRRAGSCGSRPGTTTSSWPSRPCWATRLAAAAGHARARGRRRARGSSPSTCRSSTRSPRTTSGGAPGFTEWTNIAKARPSLPGPLPAARPGRPRASTTSGSPRPVRAQAELAREHGVDGVLLLALLVRPAAASSSGPFDEVLASGEPDFPFCLAWANQTWTRHLARRARPDPHRADVSRARRRAGPLRAHPPGVPRPPVPHGRRQAAVLRLPPGAAARPGRLRRALAARWRADAGLPGLYLRRRDRPTCSAPGPSTPTRWRHGFDAGVYVRLPARATRSAATLGCARRRKARLARGATRTATEPLPDRRRRSARAAPTPSVYPNWDNTPRSGPPGVVLARLDAGAVPRPRRATPIDARRRAAARRAAGVREVVERVGRGQPPRARPALRPRLPRGDPRRGRQAAARDRRS